MRILVLALTVTSVTFAATTVYFARALYIERESRATPAVAQAAPAAVLLSKAGATPAPTTTPAMTPSSTPPESEQAVSNRMQIEQSRRLLTRIEDPEQREGLLVETKMMMRNAYPRLAQTIGMSSEEAERLFTLLSLQQMDAQEKFARCVLDPGCNIREGGYFQDDPREKEITELLGADRQQQFDNYKNTLMERESVAQLRTRLNDATRLPDGTAEALISVLAEERQQIHQEAAARGAGMNGFGTGIGVVFSASDASTPEAQMESAQASSRRMRERAAEVLTPEQLRVFDEMQDELLISLRQQIRQKQEYAVESSYATATIVN